MTGKTILEVKQLARVEGEGGLSVRFREGRVSEVRFRVMEPPRLFEAFLRGRHCSDVPDLTARICGICPLAYMLGACQAMENAVGLVVDPRAQQLRRLIFLGEWIASHSLHIFLLHAPDFFGCADALALAGKDPQMVKRGLRLKQIGNALVRCVGGREVHPVNLRIGGFYRYPDRAALLAMREDLVWALEAARDLVRWTAGFDFPDFEGTCTFLALHHPDRYALLEGRLHASNGMDLAIEDFERYVEAEQVAHSTALRTLSRRLGDYLVGPLARFNLNFAQLAPVAQDAARSVGLLPPCTNPFKSIIVRGVEILHLCQEALDLLDAYASDGCTDPPVTPLAAATGFGCVEAPRGICWHRYRLDAGGVVLDARIIPPTAQNQRAIESDLWRFAEMYQELPPERLKWRCEQLVRCYDPCISCSCHLVDVE